jgi:PAN domain
VESFSPIDNTVFETGSIRFGNVEPPVCMDACNRLGESCVGFKYNRPASVCSLVRAAPSNNGNDALYIKRAVGGYKRLASYAPYNPSTYGMMIVSGMDNAQQCMDVCDGTLSVRCEGFYYSGGAAPGAPRACKLMTFNYSQDTDMYVKQ